MQVACLGLCTEISMKIRIRGEIKFERPHALIIARNTRTSHLVICDIMQEEDKNRIITRMVHEVFGQPWNLT